MSQASQFSCRPVLLQASWPVSTNTGQYRHLYAVDHIQGTVRVPEAEVAVEAGIGELVQPVLVRIGHEGGHEVLPEGQVHRLVVLLALLQRQARVRQELIQPVLALGGEGLKLGRGVGGVSEGLYHTPVAVQCQVELGPRLD